MVRCFIVIAVLVASCAAPMACGAQGHANDPRTSNPATSRPIDPATRAWMEQAVSHILAADTDHR